MPFARAPSTVPINAPAITDVTMISTRVLERFTLR
jgi:hypothetical protein